MKHHEIKPMMERVAKFNALSARYDVLRELLKKIEPDNSSPFTGDTRETRRVSEMEIWFTQTLGGTQPVNMNLNRLHIPGRELGQFLEAQLKKQLDAVKAEMEAV